MQMSLNNTPPATNDKLVTFTDLANDPAGITPRLTLARLTNKHPITITRWVRKGLLPKPLTINKTQYFRNSDILAFINNQSA